jgi:hypothetical protein
MEATNDAIPVVLESSHEIRFPRRIILAFWSYLSDCLDYLENGNISAPEYHKTQGPRRGVMVEV